MSDYSDLADCIMNSSLPKHKTFYAVGQESMVIIEAYTAAEALERVKDGEGTLVLKRLEDDTWRIY